MSALHSRKIPKEVEQLFDKYVENHLRRLKRGRAYELLQNEFHLTEAQAEIMFDIFDKDKNGEFSIWEFQQFYSLVGDNVHDIFSLYKRLQDADGSGNLDIGATFDSLRSMRTGTGRSLKDEEIERLMMAAAGPEKIIDIQKFVNLLCRIRLMRD